MGKRHKWTAQEEEIVAQGVSKGRTPKEIAALLPNIPLASVKNKANKNRAEKRPKLSDLVGKIDSKPKVDMLFKYLLKAPSVNPSGAAKEMEEEEEEKEEIQNEEPAKVTIPLYLWANEIPHLKKSDHFSAKMCWCATSLHESRPTQDILEG